MTADAKVAWVARLKDPGLSLWESTAWQNDQQIRTLMEKLAANWLSWIESEGGKQQHGASRSTH